MLHRAQSRTTGFVQLIAIILISAVVLSYYNVNLSAFRTGIFKSFTKTFTLTRQSIYNMSSSVTTSSVTNWKQALESLPSTPEKIPAFFFAHGSPMLAFPASAASALGGGMAAYHGPNGPLAKFLADFGPTLLKKYKPKGIVVFSAHWETMGERLGNFNGTTYANDLADLSLTLVSDYSENPLLMDYYGFAPELYKLKFKSRGDSILAQRVVDLYKQVRRPYLHRYSYRNYNSFKAGLKARTTPVTESRGEDGRGFEGPGLDHGVFVPFRIMFGEEFTEIPIVQVSIDSSLDPKTNWEAGKAVAKLRCEKFCRCHLVTLN
jgi:aromatic ring-opening dioxygenase catalytic subunit (LigB family)